MVGQSCMDAWIDEQIFLAMGLRACMELCYFFVMVQFYPSYK